jgi:outer membrane protein
MIVAAASQALGCRRRHRKSLARDRFVIKTGDALPRGKTVLVLLVALGSAPHARAQSNVFSNVVQATPPRPRYTLWQCLDLALRQNPDVLIARKRIEEAAGGIIEARAGFLPSLTSFANYEYLQSRYATLAGASPDRRNEIWNVNVRLTETIYSGGAARGRMDIARLRKQSRWFEYQAAVDQVIRDTRIGFYEILRNKSDVAVHEQAVSFLSEQVKNERAKLEVGTGQKLNVLRAEVNLALEQSALVDSRNRLRNSYVRLSELLGIPFPIDREQPPFEIEGGLGYEKTGLTLNDCLTRALLLRPELTVRENEIDAQKKQLVVDRSEVLPHVDLFAGYDVVSEPDRTQPADYYNGYVAGAQVSWHLFDGLATKGRLNATRARLGAAETSYDAIHRTIEAEVLRAYRDMQKAEEQIQTQSANVQLAQQSLKLATANFDLGLTSQLELLQAQLDLTRAQTAELSARFDYNAALARLQRAMGSEFQITDERMKETK